MRDVVQGAIDAFSWFVLAYFLVLNTLYLVLVLTAAGDVFRHIRRRPFAGDEDMFASPLTPPVSVVMPAHDEEPVIVEAVHAMLALRYPEFEVVVIDDGSTDRTFAVMAEAFDLVEVPKVVPDLVPVEGELLSVHLSRQGHPLTVVRKTSTGSKADANNAGINASRYPLVCMVDADAVLDEDALLTVVKPFVDDPLRVVATGGSVRAVNDSTVHRGRIGDVRMPKRWLARIQVVEYLRSFLLGRSGWSRLQGLLIISGAFGVFRRDLLVAVGGYDAHAIGEDADLVARMHRHLRHEGRDYRIEFVSEPVCWTEVPETRAVLGRQRRRWSRGLAEVLWGQRRMMGNPRYGRIGTVVLPYYLLFELIGPFLELAGVLTVALGFSFGLLDVEFALLFLAVALGYGFLLSVVSLAIEELGYRRYPRARDMAIATLAALVENVGFRQVHAWWRIQGTWQFLRGAEHSWGTMTRTGFAAEAKEPEKV